MYHIEVVVVVQITKTPTGLTLSQTKYIQDLLTKSNMLHSKPITTPADPSTRLVLFLVSHSLIQNYTDKLLIPSNMQQSHVLI